jgi:hypothetical protein
LAVYRISGSRPRLPMIIALLSDIELPSKPSYPAVAGSPTERLARG